MQIDPKWKLEKVAAPRQDNRFATEHVMVENGHIIATDGRGLVAHPIELGELDQNGLISVEAIKASRKNDGNLTAGENVTAGGVTYPRPEKRSYPAWAAVIPDYPNDDAHVRVVIDAKLLLDIADALGAQKSDRRGSKIVSLTFPTGGTRPILVQVENEGSVGVLMPLASI